MSTFGDMAGHDRTFTNAPGDTSTAPATTAPARSLSGRGGAPVDGLDQLEGRALGLWRAAALHSRRFGRRSLASVLMVLTASRRVERIHAVATIVVRDGVSLLMWAGVWLLMIIVVTPASVLFALAVTPLLWPLVPIAATAMVVASSALGQRADIWWRWPGAIRVLAVTPSSLATSDRRPLCSSTRGLRAMASITDAISSTVPPQVNSSGVSTAGRRVTDSARLHHRRQANASTEPRPATDDGSLVGTRLNGWLT